jgi:hypothetical protein
MTRSEFLDILCLSDFGKIICVNLYRSLLVGTVSDRVVKEFLDNCVAEFEIQLPANPADAPKTIALGVATDWEVREKLVNSNLFPTPPSAKEPIQFSTVLPMHVFTGNASSAKHITYSARLITDESDFNALLKEWLDDKATWEFGLDRSFFWLQRPVNSASMPDNRRVSGNAQYHCEVFGLCHHGEKRPDGSPNMLVRALVPAELTPGMSSLYRPTALDGLDNSAFRAATDSEVSAPPAQPGTTLDMWLVRAMAPVVDGQHEWLCSPLKLSATSVVWEMLGTPIGNACNDDELFHAQVLKQMEICTPTSTALSKLKGIK